MILITGATGNIGRELLQQAVERRLRVRAFVTSPEKMAPFGARAEAATGNFSDPASFARALKGVRRLFLMSVDGNLSGFQALVEAAAKARVEHVVFLSSLATGHQTAIGELHAAKEQIINDAGLSATILRPGGFMSNVLQWAPTVHSQAVVYNPMGKGRFAAIAPEDVASVALHSLVDANVEILELTGGELMSVPEQVAVLAEAMGQELRCVDIPSQAAAERMIEAGMPPLISRGVAESFEAVRRGDFEHVQTDTVERITGRKPMRFAEWVVRHLDQFKRAEAAVPV